MTPQKTRSRRYKRLLALTGATVVAAGGSIGLAFGAGSEDAGAPAKPVMKAPASPAPTLGTHWPTPPAPGGTTRGDGGPEEGTRGPKATDTACVDPKTSGSGPQHC